MSRQPHARRVQRGEVVEQLQVLVGRRSARRLRAPATRRRRASAPRPGRPRGRHRRWRGRWTAAGGRTPPTPTPAPARSPRSPVWRMIQSSRWSTCLSTYGSPSSTTRSKRAPDFESTAVIGIRLDAPATSSSTDAATGRGCTSAPPPVPAQNCPRSTITCWGAEPQPALVPPLAAIAPGARAAVHDHGERVELARRASRLELHRRPRRVRRRQPARREQRRWPTRSRSPASMAARTGPVSVPHGPGRLAGRRSGGRGGRDRRGRARGGGRRRGGRRRGRRGAWLRWSTRSGAATRRRRGSPGPRTPRRPRGPQPR